MVYIRHTGMNNNCKACGYNLNSKDYSHDISTFNNIDNEGYNNC